jgi:hypothetical protein
LPGLVADWIAFQEGVRSFANWYGQRLTGFDLPKEYAWLRQAEPELSPSEALYKAANRIVSNMEFNYGCARICGYYKKKEAMECQE